MSILTKFYTELIRLQFGSDVPKLLLVDIVERACKKAVIREIPGITDCFESKDSDKDKKTKVLVFS